MDGPIPYPESPYPAAQQPFPPAGVPQGGPLPYPELVPSTYPGTLPPPVVYPKPSRRPLFLGVGLAIVVLVAAVSAATFLAGRSTEAKPTAAPGLNDALATTAIQGYLDALATSDTDEIARNASCGLFDAVKDPRVDLSLASLASDAFRREFSSATVASIDKIVSWSPQQAQVLLTMRAVPAGRSQAEVERQAVAQILVEEPNVLVCSFLPRSTGQY